MADHFVSLNRGQSGMLFSDFTTGTSTTAGNKIELRITDSSMTKKDAVTLMTALTRFIENPQQADVAAGFVFLNN